jgi:site-specific recombinase XerD
MTTTELKLVLDGEYWALSGADAAGFAVVNEYLTYLADRNYSTKTVRAYGFGLLARWLRLEDVTIGAITTDMLLMYLAACRWARVPGRPGPNVVSLQGHRLDRYAPSTINRRMAAINGMFVFLQGQTFAVRSWRANSSSPWYLSFLRICRGRCIFGDQNR